MISIVTNGDTIYDLVQLRPMTISQNQAFLFSFLFFLQPPIPTTTTSVLSLKHKPRTDAVTIGLATISTGSEDQMGSVKKKKKKRRRRRKKELNGVQRRPKKEREKKERKMEKRAVEETIKSSTSRVLL